MDVRDRSEVWCKIMTDVFRLTVACGVVPVPGFYDHGVSPLKTEKRQKKRNGGEITDIIIFSFKMLMYQ